MTYGTYAPRIIVHPDRHGARKTQGPNLWLVLHTSEGGETPTSAENLCRYMEAPGDRVGPSGPYGSSYQAVFDTDCIRPAVPNDVVSYSAGGGNARGVHGCFPGRASQTREQWLDENTRPMIIRAAEWAIDQSIAENIPLRRLTVAEVRAYKAGVCDHHDISLAFGQSDHTDVGEQFPWDSFWNVIDFILNPPTPPEFSNMNTLFRLKTTADVFKIIDGNPVPLSAHALEVEMALGTPNLYGIKNDANSKREDPRQSPAPFHNETKKWLEHRIGYSLSPSPV